MSTIEAILVFGIIAAAALHLVLRFWPKSRGKNCGSESCACGTEAARTQPEGKPLRERKVLGGNQR